jgi:hypothetical protein
MAVNATTHVHRTRSHAEYIIPVTALAAAATGAHARVLNAQELGMIVLQYKHTIV